MMSRFTGDRILFWALLALLWSLPGQGQTTSSPAFGWQGTVHGGDILIHSPEMSHFTTDFSSSVEVNLFRQTIGQNTHQVLYGYPRFGVSASWTRFGNDDLLGWAIGLFPYCSINYYRSPTLNMHVRLGAGLSYLNRPYDAQTNPRNTAIGSVINNIVSMGTGLTYKIGPRNRLFGQLTLTHYSNAAFASPNLGINVPTLALGYQHYFSEYQFESIPRHKLDSFENGYHLDARLGFALKEGNIPNGPKYPIFLTTLAVERKVSRINKVSLGIYTAYNYTLHDYFILKESRYQEKPKNSLRIGLEVGDEFLYKNVGLIGKVGVYLYNRHYELDPVYTRIGVKYYFWDHRLYAGTILKAHRFIADYVEWSVGVRL